MHPTYRAPNRVGKRNGPSHPFFVIPVKTGAQGKLTHTKKRRHKDVPQRVAEILPIRHSDEGRNPAKGNAKANLDPRLCEDGQITDVRQRPICGH